jgi:two-component system, NarL family, nitrate/nitrite response regulator NarL
VVGVSSAGGIPADELDPSPRGLHPWLIRSADCGGGAPKRSWRDGDSQVAQFKVAAARPPAEAYVLGVAVLSASRGPFAHMTAVSGPSLASSRGRGAGSAQSERDRRRGAADVAPRSVNGPVRVLVADRNELYLGSLVLMIERDRGQELVGATTTGSDALDQIRRGSPAVAVLDPGLADVDGLSILNAVERDCLHTRIVLLSAEPCECSPFEAIAAGARGYMTKQASEQELSTAILAAAHGSAVFSQRIHPALTAEIRQRAQASPDPLDPVTREVLARVAAGLTPAQVADELHLSTATVRTHLHIAYKGLGVHAATAAVAEGIRRNLID